MWYNFDRIEGYKSVPELTDEGRKRLEKGESEYTEYKIDENMNIIFKSFIETCKK